ncbi:MAG: hypothetical protein KAH01_01850 [Caldisericia bacterium]|nr:hypothetical protein [Caldisericia bacterium]
MKIMLKKFFGLLVSFVVVLQILNVSFAFSSPVDSSDPMNALNSPYIGNYDHCIITKLEFVPLFLEYKTFMFERGISTFVCPYEFLLEGFDGKNDADRIRNGLLDLYTNHNIKSAWLVGDYDMIPIPKVYIYSSGSEEYRVKPIYTDFLYSSLKNEWVPEEDGFHGYFEKNYLNFNTDIQIGRLPFSDPKKIEKYIDHLLAFYEEPESERNRCLTAGAWLHFKEESRYTLKNDLFDVDGGNIVYTDYKNYFSNFEHAGLYEMEGMKVSKCHMYGNPLNYKNFIDTFNSFDPSVVLLCGNGDYSSISQMVWTEDKNSDLIANWDEINTPSFIDLSTLSKLKSSHHPVVFADSGSTCGYDHYSLGSEFLENIAVGFLGTTYSSNYFLNNETKPLNYELNTSSFGLTALIEYFFSKYNTMGNSIKEAIDLYWELCLKSTDEDLVPYFMENIYSLNFFGDPLLVLNNRPCVEKIAYNPQAKLIKGELPYNLKEVSIAEDDYYFYCKFSLYEDIKNDDFAASLFLDLNPDNPGDPEFSNSDCAIILGFDKDDSFFNGLLLWNPYKKEWDLNDSNLCYNRFIVNSSKKYILLSFPKSLLKNNSFKYRFCVSDKHIKELSTYPDISEIEFAEYPPNTSEPKKPGDNENPDPEDPPENPDPEPEPEPEPKPQPPKDPPPNPPKKPEPPKDPEPEPKPQPPKEPENGNIVRKILIQLKIGDLYALVNDDFIKLDIAPLEKDDRVFVPLRFIAESFGAEIEWEEDESNNGEGTIKITYTKADSSKILVQMHTLYTTAYITFIKNDTVVKTEEIQLDVAPFIVKPENRTVVPVRFISESFGAEIEWDEKTKTIQILLQEKEA